MAKEGDQTKWVGVRPTDPSEDIPTTTKKLAPAIGDLQAIKAPFVWNYAGNNKDCTVEFSAGTTWVSAGEIVIINQVVMANKTSLCDLLFEGRLRAATRKVSTHFSYEPTIISNWTGFLVLVEDDYLLFRWQLGGAADSVFANAFGYKIGVY